MSLLCFLPQLNISTSFGLRVIIRHQFVRWTVFREGYRFNWGNEVTGGSLEALLQLLPTKHRVPNRTEQKTFQHDKVITVYHTD